MNQNETNEDTTQGTSEDAEKQSTLGAASEKLGAAADKLKDAGAKIMSSGVTKTVAKGFFKVMYGFANAVGEGLAEARLDMEKKSQEKEVE